MYDHRGFGTPTRPCEDFSDNGFGTFIRMTPVPKKEVPANATISSSNTTKDCVCACETRVQTGAGVGVDVCACACDKHAKPLATGRRTSISSAAIKEYNSLPLRLLPVENGVLPTTAETPSATNGQESNFAVLKMKAGVEDLSVKTVGSRRNR